VAPSIPFAFVFTGLTHHGHLLAQLLERRDPSTGQKLGDMLVDTPALINTWGARRSKALDALQKKALAHVAKGLTVALEAIPLTAPPPARAPEVAGASAADDGPAKPVKVKVTAADVVPQAPAPLWAQAGAAIERSLASAPISFGLLLSFFMCLFLALFGQSRGLAPHLH
jgi:hypothetical protein